ncbi:MAG: creatininase family protein [Polyangiaceae bacterium]
MRPRVCPFDLPRAEARRLLSAGATVFLTINPVEYHGPHLSLHNDAWVSRGLVSELADALGIEGTLLVGADLEVGVDPCPGPGTRHTSLPTASALVREACRAVVELGASRVVLMTFHGSPLHAAALYDGVQECERLGARAAAPLHAAQAALMALDVGERGSAGPLPAELEAFADAVEHVADRSHARALLANIPRDFHAGFVETSLALHFAPDTVDPIYRSLPPCPPIAPNPALDAASRTAELLGRTELARELRYAALGSGWYALRPFPGYTGEPALATAAAGAAIARHIVRFLADVVRPVLDTGSSAPRPPLGWLRPMTLGGRVRTVHVPLDAVMKVSPLR